MDHYEFADICASSSACVPSFADDEETMQGLLSSPLVLQSDLVSCCSLQIPPRVVGGIVALFWLL